MARFPDPSTYYTGRLGPSGLARTWSTTFTSQSADATNFNVNAYVVYTVDASNGNRPVIRGSNSTTNIALFLTKETDIRNCEVLLHYRYATADQNAGAIYAPRALARVWQGSVACFAYANYRNTATHGLKAQLNASDTYAVDPPLANQTTKYQYCKLRVVDGVILAKYWFEDVAEPDWQHAHLGGATTTPEVGACGIYQSFDSANVYIDSLSITELLWNDPDTYRKVYQNPSWALLLAADATPPYFQTFVNDAVQQAEVIEVTGPYGYTQTVGHIKRPALSWQVAPSAPTVATGLTGGSIVGNKTYKVKIVYFPTDAGLFAIGLGESQPSASTDIVVALGTGINTITVTSPSSPGGVTTAYRVYVNDGAGGSTYWLQKSTNSAQINAGSGSVIQYATLGTDVVLTSLSASGTTAPVIGALPTTLVKNVEIAQFPNQQSVSAKVFPRYTSAPWIRWRGWTKGTNLQTTQPGLNAYYAGLLDNYYSSAGPTTLGNGGTAAGAGYHPTLNPADTTAVGAGTWGWSYLDYLQHMNNWERNSSLLSHALLHNAGIDGEVWLYDLNGTPWYICTLASDGRSLTIDYGYMWSPLRFSGGFQSGLLVKSNGNPVGIANAVPYSYTALAAEINENDNGSGGPATTSQTRSKLLVTLQQPIPVGAIVTVEKQGGNLCNSEATPLVLPDFGPQAVTNNSLITAHIQPMNFTRRHLCHS